MTLRVELVIPEGEIWSGNAQMVIAKTLDGDIGVLTGHAPVIGILAEGSVVQIRAEDEGGASVFAAVSGGFLSIADDQVSILARQAQLGAKVDRAAVQAELDAVEAGDGAAAGADESAQVRYSRALLRASDGS